MKHDKLAAPKGAAEKVEGKAVSDKELSELVSMLRTVDHDHDHHGHHDSSHHNSKVSHGRRR